MRKASLANSRLGITVGEVRLADTFLTRLRGLIGRPTLQKGQGLWVKPCRQVHMFGMHYSLSIWFLNQEGKVLQIIDELKPGEVSPLNRMAASVLEFPAEWAKMTGTQIGDQLWQMNEES